MPVPNQCHAVLPYGEIGLWICQICPSFGLKLTRSEDNSRLLVETEAFQVTAVLGK